MGEPKSLHPSAASASPSVAPKERELKLNEEEVEKLIPTSFKVSRPGVPFVSKSEVIKELFTSEREFRALAQGIIAEKIKENPQMPEKEQKDAVSNGLLSIIKARYKAFDDKSRASDARHSRDPGHVRAMVKAQAFFETLGKEAPDSISFEAEKKEGRYLAYYNKKTGELNVILLKTVKKEGFEGTTGIVSKVFNVTKNKFEAFKQAKIPPGEEALRERQFREESEILSAIDSTVFYIADGIIGFTSTWHDAEMFEVVTSTDSRLTQYATPKHRQQYAHETVRQFYAFQEEQHLSIPDLKPENLMLHIERDQKEHGLNTSLKFIDLGDALNFDDVADQHGEVNLGEIQKIMDKIRNPLKPAGALTSTYTSRPDFNIFLELTQRAKDTTQFPKTFDASTPPEVIKTTLEFLKEYQAALEKRMVFTCGMTCHALLTSQFPFDQAKAGDYGEFPVTIMKEKPLIQELHLRRKGYSDKVIDVFKKMMAHKPEERMKPDVVKGHFATFRFLSKEECEVLGTDVVKNLKQEAQLNAQTIQIVKKYQNQHYYLQKEIQELEQQQQKIWESEGEESENYKAISAKIKELTELKKAYSIPFTSPQDQIKKLVLLQKRILKDEGTESENYQIISEDINQLKELEKRLEGVRKLNGAVTDFNPYVEDYL